jgi:hypothetical protein
LLRDGVPVQQVFELLPEKMSLLEKTRVLDAPLQKLKDTWSVLKKQGASLPEDIMHSLKEVEQVLQEIILLDEQNRNLMQTQYQDSLLNEKPKTIEQNSLLRAKKAYSSTNRDSSKVTHHA